MVPPVLSPFFAREVGNLKGKKTAVSRVEIHRYVTRDVTSALARKNQNADHSQGGGGTVSRLEKPAKFFVVKILTSKS
jgi:hypothetical protein